MCPNNVNQYPPSSDKLQITLLYKVPTHDELVDDANSSIKPKNKPCPRIICDINNKPIKFLVDTGSQISCISNEVFEKINQKGNNIPMLPLSGIKVVCNAVGKQFTNIRKQIYCKIKIDQTDVYTILVIIDNLNEHGILGSDFLEEHKAQINYVNNDLQLIINNNSVKIKYSKNETECPILNIRLPHHQNNLVDEQKQKFDEKEECTDTEKYPHTTKKKKTRVAGEFPVNGLTKRRDSLKELNIIRTQQADEKKQVQTKKTDERKDCIQPEPVSINKLEIQHSKIHTEEKLKAQLERRKKATVTQKMNIEVAQPRSSNIERGQHDKFNKLCKPINWSQVLVKDLHNHLQYDLLYQPAKQQLERISRALNQERVSTPGTHNAGTPMA